MYIMKKCKGNKYEIGMFIMRKGNLGQSVEHQKRQGHYV